MQTVVDAPYEAKAEIKLLRAIFAQATMDLASKSNRERTAAMKWFLDDPPNSMLVWLCSWLGYDVQHVRKTARVMYAMPREELRKLVAGLVDRVRDGEVCPGLLAEMRRRRREAS